MDKLKIEKNIDVLGSEIARVHTLIAAISEIVKQCNLNAEVYKKYSKFFDDVYYAFYNELIHTVSKLHDKSRDSLSIVRMLQANKDKKSIREEAILQQICEHDAYKKIKIIRDKLGRAHLDAKISINPGKQRELYEAHKIALKNIAEYIELMTEALETISERLDIPILLSKPSVPIKREITEIFNELNSRLDLSKMPETINNYSL